jgi:hypothetical protein
MKQIPERELKKLEVKLANVFQEEINELTADLQRILLCDMVTAFKNRFQALNQACKNPDILLQTKTYAYCSFGI